MYVYIYVSVSTYTLTCANCTYVYSVRTYVCMFVRSPSLCIKGTSLNMAALALAGYNTQADALWQRTCRDLKDSLKEPYLRAMFTFLTSKRDFSSLLVIPPYVYLLCLRTLL